MSVIHIFLNNSMLDFVNIEQEEAFLASLMQWAMDGRRSACSCPVVDGRADCKGDDETEPNYLFLGPKGGHPRRSNYADRYLTPAAEGFYPARNGTRRPVYVTAGPWPGIPIRKGNWKTRAADVADGTWPDLTGKFRPHDDRHTHATWLDAADLHKVIQMDRRGHAMPGMDAVYNHITLAMRQRLGDVLEQLWRDAVASATNSHRTQRYRCWSRSSTSTARPPAPADSERTRQFPQPRAACLRRPRHRRNGGSAVGAPGPR
jgi:hypothetical protein